MACKWIPEQVHYRPSEHMAQRPQINYVSAQWAVKPTDTHLEFCDV